MTHLFGCGAERLEGHRLVCGIAVGAFEVYSGMPMICH
jgi:hypothetical protein